MGTWGSGNFDSDAACDYRDEMTKGLTARIDEVLSGSDPWQDEEVVMASVQMLSVFVEHCEGHPPKPMKVVGWRGNCLAVYDALLVEAFASSDFRTERRRVIAETFERLEAQARDFWPEEIRAAASTGAVSRAVHTANSVPEEQLSQLQSTIGPAAPGPAKKRDRKRTQHGQVGVTPGC